MNRPSPIFLTFTIILNIIPAPISLGVAIANISKNCSSPVAAFLIISAAINVFMTVFASYLYWQFGKPYQSVRVPSPNYAGKVTSENIMSRAKTRLLEPAKYFATIPWFSSSFSVRSHSFNGGRGS